MVVVGMACPENSEKIAWGKSQVVMDSKASSNGKLLICMGRPVEKVPSGSSTAELLPAHRQ